MRRTLTLVFAVLALGIAPVRGGEAECCAAKLKATQDRIGGLIQRWEEQSKNFISLSEEERAGLSKELADLAGSCPIGSRVVKTLAIANRALADVIAAEEACGASCSASEKETATAETAAGKEGAACCEKLAGALRARRELLASVANLARQAAAATGGGSCCAAAAGEKLASAECAKACEQAGEATKLASAEEKAFCAKSVAVAVRGESCDVKAAQLLIAQVEGLSCEKQAAALVADIRKAGCDDAATEIVAKAAAECAKAACAKETEAAATLAAAEKAGEKGACCADTAGSACTGACAASAAGLEVSAKSAKATKADLKALSASLKELRKSWKNAAGEFAAIPAEKRSELLARVGKLQERHQAFKLVPESVAALKDGLALLSEIDAHLLEQVKTDETLAASIPTDALKAFKQRAGVIRKLGKTFDKACAAMASVKQQEQ